MNIRTVKQLGARITNGVKPKSSITIDAPAIRELAELLVETGLTEIEVESGGQRLRVAKQLAPVVHHRTESSAPITVESPQAAKVVATETQPTRGGLAITSPLVGTVYVAPEPGKPPFVKVGDVVKEGDTLLIVEAMKTMNPIIAPRAGTVSEICIADAEPIEFGQNLLFLA